MLITGPWLESSSEYSCLFDHISVPAALIQPGVLRCYCPGNTLVLVKTLFCLGFFVLNALVFLCEALCELYLLYSLTTHTFLYL